MHIASGFRRFPRVCEASIYFKFDPSLASEVARVQGPMLLNQWQKTENFSSAFTYGVLRHFSLFVREGGHLKQHLSCSLIPRICLTTEANNVDESSTESANDLYVKMLKSVESKTMPPNAWLWSLIDKCGSREDVKVLFQMLERLRRFRLSSLRIHENFNSHLCQRVAEACTRVGALDFGKKVLWKHNVYGLTPTVASVHSLLMYAREHGDVELLVDIMKLVKRNDLPLQPGMADIVFSICSSADKWDMLSKYSQKFIKAGVKLRRTSFGTWMDFAARRGDVQSLWKIEDLRLKIVKQHNIATGFSCAKGHILGREPEKAASIILALKQNLPDHKRLEILSEIQKMVTTWPSEVLKHQKKEDRKALADSLRQDIPKMIGILSNEGLEVLVDTKDLIREEALHG